MYPCVAACIAACDMANLFFYDGIEETNGSATMFYPNSADSKVWVESLAPIHTYEVYNTLGSLIYSVEINAERFEIDIEGLPEGPYMIRLVSDGFVNTRKIVVKR